jgi:hypothetical protein
MSTDEILNKVDLEDEKPEGEEKEVKEGEEGEMKAPEK